MGSKAKGFFEKFKNDVAKMKEQAPDTVNGFAAMFSKIMKDGALTLREKELITLGIGVAGAVLLVSDCTCKRASTLGQQSSRYSKLPR
ncbi:MAG: carboxymuconolactone decarboxylase family protein [Sedimentisphaerales bacterium]